MSGRHDDQLDSLDGIDPRLERILRDVLGARDPGSATLSLRARVDRVPLEGPAARNGTLRRATPWLAAAAAVVLLVGLGGAAVLLPPSVPLGAGGPATLPPAAFDPMATGFGVVEALDRTVLLLLVVLSTLLLGIGAAGTTGRAHGALVAAAIAVPVVFTAGALVPAPFFTAGGASGEGLVSGSVFDVPDGDRPQLFVVAAPGAPYSHGISIENDGFLPVRLDGFVDVAGEGTVAAVWLDALPAQGFLGPASPFEPMTLGPGQAVSVWIVGRAAPCAVGPSWNPDSDSTAAASYTELVSLRVRWSILGLPREDPVELPYSITTPRRDGCPAP